MRVRVNEAGQNAAAFGVVHACVRADVRLDFVKPSRAFNQTVADEQRSAFDDGKLAHLSSYARSSCACERDELRAVDDGERVCHALFISGRALLAPSRVVECRADEVDENRDGDEFKCEREAALDLDDWDYRECDAE